MNIMNREELEDFKNNLETEDEKVGFEKLYKLYNKEITPVDFYNEIMAIK